MTSYVDAAFLKNYFPADYFLLSSTQIFHSNGAKCASFKLAGCLKVFGLGKLSLQGKFVPAGKMRAF